MKVSWTKGLMKDVAVSVTQSYREALVTRKRLTVLLTDKINASQHSARSKEGYENPNWAYMQADAKGMKEQCKKSLV